MSERSFRLVPFEASMAASPFHLSGRLRREGSVLSLRYKLNGPTGNLRLPAAAAQPRRRDGLWEHTCLECFLAVSGKPRYWEVNLSPGGDWNVYRLSGYRSNLTPETAFRSLPFSVERDAGQLRLELSLDLAAIVAPEQSLDLGLCAILEAADGSLSHWALAHGAAAPDFHRREDFRLRL